MRFARQLLKLCSVGQEWDVSVLWVILTSLTVDRVIHKFEELLHHLGLGGGPEIGLHRYLRWETA